MHFIEIYNFHFSLTFTINRILEFSLGDEDAEPVTVNAENCNDQFCEVRRGIVSKFEMTFKAITEATKMSSSFKAQIAGTWISWPISGESSDVCKNLIQGKCPVPANSEATYRLNFKIPTIAPIGTRTIVQLRITDQNSKGVACTRFPVLVVS